MTDLELALDLLMDSMRSVCPTWPTPHEFAAYVLVEADPDDPSLGLDVRNALELARRTPVATLEEIYDV